MPSPYRGRVTNWIAGGFCRREVQKVLRAYLAKGAPATQCLDMYFYVGKVLRDLKTSPHHEAELGHAVWCAPYFFSELLQAMRKSSIRFAELPDSNYDKIIEANISRLLDRQGFPTLGEAFAGKGLKAEQLASLYARLNAMNRTWKFWVDRTVQEERESMRAKRKRASKGR